MGNKKSKPTLPDMHLKMVLVGSAGSGKSSVFTRITSNQFSYHYTQTTSVKIGSIVKKINVPIECSISVALWDLPGLEEVDMRKSYYQDIDGAVVVVNITDIDSIIEVPFLKADLLNLTHTTSELATYQTTPSDEGIQPDASPQTDASPTLELQTNVSDNICETAETPNTIAEDKISVEDGQLEAKLVDIPTLLLGSKVDELVLDEEQEALHGNVAALGKSSGDAQCTGWVPVSAKENDRSIDLAFTSFLRFLVEKKLNIEQLAGNIKGLEKLVVPREAPIFMPPSTAATRLRERGKEEEDEYAKRLPLIQHELVDEEYKIIRKLIGKIRRGHKDWNLAYRRFRKSAIEYNVADNSQCSIEELVLNLKENIPENALKAVEFQGWIKLELDDQVADVEDMSDDVLEILDSFNYELVPNAAFVATTVKNAMITVKECRTRLSLLHVPSTCTEQVKLNNSEIALLLEQCETCTAAVQRLRTAVEHAVMW